MIELTSQAEAGPPFRMYCRGTAGVGKSFLIDVIADALEMMYGINGNRMCRPTSLLLAPTGVAALAIKGKTIHSMLSIPVKDNERFEAPYEALSDEKRELMRKLYSNVKLIIIDEISMVSAIMLAKINLRLQEIAGNKKLFGGFNVLVFGDLLQLPPVAPFPAFNSMDQKTIVRKFGASGAGTNLWHSFQFYELAINNRQNDNSQFADMLAHLRVGKLTEDDVTMLERRCVVATGGDRIQQIEKASNKINCIDRHSTMYSVTRIQRRSRTQFPIVTTYGATNHNAQDLTLSSVLVSTENKFGPSQMFVSLSRVKVVDGLTFIRKKCQLMRQHLKSTNVSESWEHRILELCMFVRVSGGNC